MFWPNKVWEMGDTLKGKQLWYSRILTKEDKLRRLEYERKYEERRNED